MHLDTECHFEFKFIAKLENWTLTFANYSDSWRGGAGNILEKDGDHVWGVVWETDQDRKDKLDEQEKISTGLYENIQLKLKTQRDQTFMCGSYRMVNPNNTLVLPSPHYKDVIIREAMQHKLPQDYISQLKNIADNRFDGTVQLYEALGLSFS